MSLSGSNQVDVLAELERAGIHFEFLPNDWVRVLCPFHHDSNPSCDINVNSRMFKCHSCNASGDFVGFLARKLNQGRWLVKAELEKRYGGSNDRVIDPSVIERFHEQIWEAGPLLTELRKRAVTDDMIRRYRLGESGGRITIPVKNTTGNYVNVVSYMPGAPKGVVKFQHMRGRGKIPRLYPYEQLRYDKIMLCGGFMKAIVAAEQLNEIGIGAVTAASGETNWDPVLYTYFSDKDTFVCLDIDYAGEQAAEERCAGLLPFASKIYKIVLPLDKSRYPKGDINDYVAAGHKLLPLLQEASEWKPAIMVYESDEPPIEDIALDEALQASYSGKRMKVKALVAAIDQSVYHLPGKVRVKCDRQQEVCGLCPVFSMDREPIVELPAEHPTTMAMIHESDEVQPKRLKEALMIPPDCKSVTFFVEKRHHAEDVRVCPDLSMTSETPDSVYAPVIAINSRLEMNETYWLTGRMLPHPKTQMAYFVVSDALPAVDALSSFQLSEPERLEQFRPDDWSLESLTHKISDIYDDMENEVTRIYQRRSLHIAVDLAYHSCMLIPYGDRREKGWVEILVVSDTSQGKSTCVKRMKEHYGLGETVECKNATTAGLIGGLAQFDGSKKWFAKWGVFPTHDRRLVILEELKGMAHDVFSKLTDMRSSGIADVPKIERRRAHARTRLIALTNTRRGRDVGAYGYGVDTLKELIPNLEDIRRFDLSLILSKDEVDVRALHSKESTRSRDPRYDADSARQLILWAWTRGPEDVKVAEETNAILTKETLRLCDKYSDDLPLIDRGGARHKLARMATALACRTFSSDEDCEHVIVRPCHVEFVSRFIDECYSTKAHGYADYSKRKLTAKTIKNEKKVLNEILASPFPRDLATNLLETHDIDPLDVQNWCGWDKQLSAPFISVLTRNNALEREGQVYRKTAAFVQMLQKSLSNGVFEKLPEHLEDAAHEEERF